MPSGGWVGVSSDRLKQAQEGKSANEGKDYDEVRRKLMAAYDKAQKDYLMIVGSPKTVIERVKTILRLLRVSILTVFQVQGTVSNDDRRTSMRLFAQEVMPALREYAKELDLPDPFERFPGPSSCKEVSRDSRSGSYAPRVPKAGRLIKPQEIGTAALSPSALRLGSG